MVWLVKVGEGTQVGAVVLLFVEEWREEEVFGGLWVLIHNNCKCKMRYFLQKESIKCLNQLRRTEMIAGDEKIRNDQISEEGKMIRCDNLNRFADRNL